MRRVFLDLLSEVPGFLNREVDKGIDDLHPAASHCSFAEMFKFLMKKLDHTTFHTRMTSILSVPCGTILELQLLQIERSWVNKADVMFSGEFATCSVEVDKGCFGHFGRLVRIGYVINNHGFDDAQGADIPHIPHDDDVYIDLM